MPHNVIVEYSSGIVANAMRVTAPRTMQCHSSHQDKSKLSVTVQANEWARGVIALRVLAQSCA